MAVAHTPYDTIAYPGTVVANTCPDHLALCSFYHGGPKPPIYDFCLVELGCGDGANLLPLAFYHTESIFIGIDNADNQLQRARQGADFLGLSNIRFEHRDVRDFHLNDFSSCDYVIAHGLYSWVPKDVREAILSFCNQYLRKNGLAYISYNAQPGWALRDLVRQILQRSKSVMTFSNFKHEQVP